MCFTSLRFNYFISVRCRGAPVRGAYQVYHDDDDDDDDLTRKNPSPI